MKRGVVLSLDRLREGLRIPTCTASILAELAGGTVTERRPGRIVVILPEGEVVAEIRVRIVDVGLEDARVRRELAAEQQTKPRT